MADRIDWHADRRDWRPIVDELRKNRAPRESMIAARIRRSGAADLCEIVEIAAKIAGVEVSDVMGSCRHPDVIAARMIYVGASRALTTCSFPEIAKGIGRSAHSTVHRQSGMFNEWPRSRRESVIEEVRLELEGIKHAR